MERQWGVRLDRAFCNADTGNIILAIKDNNILPDLSKLHTTPMGVKRIRRNLGLTNDDVVGLCRRALHSADMQCVRRGKNYYISNSDYVFTVNVASHTIITAHRLGNWRGGN